MEAKTLDQRVLGDGIEPADVFLQYLKGSAYHFHNVRKWSWIELDDKIWCDLPASWATQTKLPVSAHYPSAIGSEPPNTDFGITLLRQYTPPNQVIYAGVRNGGVGFWSSKIRPKELMDELGD